MRGKKRGESGEKPGGKRGGSGAKPGRKWGESGVKREKSGEEVEELSQMAQMTRICADRIAGEDGRDG